MTEWVLPLVPVWGPWLVALTTFLSCLALPVPASLVMLAAGGFAAAGDLSLWQVTAAAFAGAVAGDHLGYALGRSGAAALVARRAQDGALARAGDFLRRRGGVAVFLSRWLLSPLGPYVNVAGGAAGLPVAQFTPADLAGEAVWVAVYTGLGYLFADRIVALGQILGNASGALAAAALAAGLGVLLFRRART